MHGVQINYRSRRVPVSHPLAVVNSSLSLDGTTVHVRTHRLVLWDKIGPGPHPCHWCGRELVWRPGEHAGGNTLTVDHVNGDPKDNTPSNLVAACQACNVTRTRQRNQLGRFT